MPPERIRTLARWTVRLLVVVPVVEVLELWFTHGTDAGRQLANPDLRTAAPTAGEAAALMVSLLAAVPGIALIVVFLVWLHRCHLQVESRHGPQVLPYGSGLAIGCWFIPLANLVMPFLHVRALFRNAATDPPAPLPRGLWVWWITFAVVPTVLTVAVVWWTISQMSSAMLLDDGELAQPTATLPAITAGMRVVAAVLAIRLFRELTARLDRLVDPAAREGTVAG